MRLTAEQVAWHDDQRDAGPDAESALTGLFGSVFRGAVLDAGGGTGGASRLLARTGARPVLVDLSPDMLGACPDPAVPRVRADLTRLPFPDGVFDGVHAAYALQNVRDWRAAVAEVVRVVRAGGPLLVGWGSERVDPLLAALRSRYQDCVRGWSGVAAERGGLDGVEDADRAMAAAGCRLRGRHAVTGAQRRSARQLLVRTAGNPFQSRPPERVRAAALDAALAWAQGELGDLDAPREVEVRHDYRLYRRDAAAVPRATLRR